METIIKRNYELIVRSSRLGTTICIPKEIADILES